MHHPRLRQLVRRLHPRIVDIAGPISRLEAGARREDLQSRVHGSPRRRNQLQHTRLRASRAKDDDGAQQDRLSAVSGIQGLGLLLKFMFSLSVRMQ